MKAPMLRLPIPAVVLAALLVSCSPKPIEEAVYDDFMLNYLSPVEWDKELDEMREDRRQERLSYLEEVRGRIDEERMLYARRCNPLTEADSTNCQSADDLNSVILILEEIRVGLLKGHKLKDGLGARLNYGLSENRIEERKQIAQRVKKHFLPEEVKAN